MIHKSVKHTRETNQGNKPGNKPGKTNQETKPGK